MSAISRHTGTHSYSWTAVLTNPQLTGRRETIMTVTLRHNVLSGSRQVLIDGSLLPGSKGTTGFFRLTPQSDGSRVGDELLFQVPRSDVASGNVDLRILVKPNILSSALYEYKCFVDGVELKELAQAPPASASPSPNFKINVHEYRVEKDASGKACKTRFRLEATLNGSTSPSVWASFSEISNVVNICKSSYKHSHLSSSFPTFPSRCYDLRVDQFGESFLNERKANLESFFRNFVGFPRISERAELLRFFQLPVGAPASL
ncbi:hypothetical protein TrCOL_g5086 [Triparma columacea]|uniref:PX domain-containing protein n=1 Tax=Triparma columacea TaxID=722753 RepID=A0A9W7GBX6_9STRA|nr:hypothetical protein TrCOL_g5086 [Triparma columacea]